MVRLLGLALLLMATAAMPLDLRKLWDFSNPAASEERMRAALATAQGDEALILQTQIAQAGAEAQVRYWLELGRTWASATHKPEQLTAEAEVQARDAYDHALSIAKASKLDALAIDTVHMYAFVDTDAQSGIRWADEGLKLAKASTQPEARRWEATLRNNRGVALNELKRHDEALAELKTALQLTQADGNTIDIRVAHWMVANTLRLMGRLDDALAIQLRLEREWEAADDPDPFVFEELEAIYKAQGDAERAAHYAARLKATEHKK